MTVKWKGQTDPLCLINGKAYNVLAIEKGWYRIVDESGEDYLYPSDNFEIIEELGQDSTMPTE